MPPFSLSVGAADEALSESEFRSQYQVALAKFRDNYRNVECRADCWKEKAYSESAEKHEFTAHLLVKGDSVVAALDYGTDTADKNLMRNRVHCVTAEYSFTIRKPKPDASFLLTNVARHPAQTERDRLSLSRILDIYVFAASHMFEVPVELLIEKPTFIVKKIERFSESAEDLVALEFQLKDDPWYITSGRIVFSPSLNWAVREYYYRCDFTDTDYTTYTGKNTYSSDQQSEVPFPETGEHEVMCYHAGIPPIIQKYRAKITDVSIGTVEDAAFRLTHYGLPDAPLTARGSATNRIRWLLIGNGVLLLLGVCWWMVMKRKNVIRTESNP